MKKRDIGLEIIEGLKEIRSHKKDKTKLKTTKLNDDVAWVEALSRNPT